MNRDVAAKKAKHKKGVIDIIRLKQCLIFMISFFITFANTGFHSYANSQDIVIAVIDSGISDHILGHKISEDRFNIIYQNQNVKDETGHGTKVSSIIERYTQEYPNIKILPIKVTNKDRHASFYNVVKAIDYAVRKGANVINLSLGSPVNHSDLKIAIDKAVNRGVFIVAASGNTGENDYYYPAAYENVISVGGIGVQNNITWFSTSNDQVDMVAQADQVKTINHFGMSVKSAGTSFAAPYVSSQIAILLSEYPNASYDEILKVLYETSIDGGDIGYDIYYGNGIADISLSKDYFNMVVREKYYEWNPMITNNPDKEFTIGYNKPIVDIGEIVVIDEYYNKYPILSYVDRNKVVVIPKHRWNDNQVYTLCINGTKAEDGTILSKNVKMKFKVESEGYRHRRFENHDFVEFEDVLTLE